MPPSCRTVHFARRRYPRHIRASGGGDRCPFPGRPADSARDTPKGGNSLVGGWTQEHHRLVSIGMRIRGGVTGHGSALNVDPDLGVYDRFTAGRPAGVPMTSPRRMADRHHRGLPGDREIRDAVAARLGA